MRDLGSIHETSVQTACRTDAAAATGSGLGAGFPRKTDQADRAVPGWRPQRHHRARDRPAHVRDYQAAGADRQPRRPGRRARHRRGRDGPTIAISSAGALAISPSMERVAYDTLKDFAPVTLVATVPEMLVVATNVPAKDMKELIALAKAQPGKLNFASSGPGSLPHLAGELLKLTANIDIVHVPYRGAAPAVNDLLGQQVQMTFLDLPVLLPQVKAGALRPIAIGAPERAPTAMEVPTTAEAGMPGMIIENWYGMVAPAATPPAIIASL